jgi:hypothetical protein
MTKDLQIGDFWRGRANKTNMNFEKDYGGLDYTDAIVLDVGCAFHTPDFFLDKGAKHVIAIDYFDGRMKVIFEYAEKFGNVTPIEMKITTPQQLEEIYLEHRPTIAKYDCDGCEVVALDMDNEVFAIPEQYVVETHERYLPSVKLYGNPNTVENVHRKFIVKLRECGYKITREYRSPPWKGKPSWGNIKARR